VFDYAGLAQLYTRWIDYPSFILEHDFSREEYEVRLTRARALMAQADLDALVITSSPVGQWFTSRLEPHEWHDRCQARSAWYILTHAADYLFMTPSAGGEHFNTTRRSTHVGTIRAIVERIDPAEQPRFEIWGLAQIPQIFTELGLGRGRLGFELGDCMTLGITVNDFLWLREQMAPAQLVDGSAVIRKLMQIQTPLEIERVRTACHAGAWIHAQVPTILQPGMTERDFLQRLSERFAQAYDQDYHYEALGHWDIRNPITGDSIFYHQVATDRVFQVGDTICRGFSGVTFRGYPGDIDRVWHIGNPSDEVQHLYRANWECVRAMEAAIRPGVACSEVYAACARVERAFGLPERLVGRIGHGIRNTSGISIHPDCQLILEPGMIVSCEPMFGNEAGWFDLEDQFVVTADGCEALNPPAPETIPCILP
jgi:Xaa-Pro aminopeptidase